MDIYCSASSIVRPKAAYSGCPSFLVQSERERLDYSRRDWLVRDQTMPVCSLELNPSFS
jgi:hypothetical protein